MKNQAKNSVVNSQETFFEKVYEVVRQIPYGRVSTYGDIAEFLGARGSARMVGWAMNASHQAYPPVPAHRVVNRQGLLTGKFHFQTPDMMEKLLQNEGIEVEDNRVVHFIKIRWVPSKELIKREK
ncbi:MAG TPA: MGMT family protein [Bacteroidia bacterium]|nr:MGMT family protein [Sphingobacteriales bacterium]HPD63866.1 MGMT family protein [Bacteroidia bacterium]HRS57773.1 MGMT family protein [Bacteroidia bacterium]HRU67286.1 MGMT family protein [Bacteroidia bacterium]